ncbi:hypothetical protein G6F56_009180 [Rhizopus delemar]|nr:hypothetical protein G6F56_009180 [Rhizopus delemar]
MNSLRVALNKLPPIATIKILRKTFSLPASTARLILNDIAKPRSSHKSWIRQVPWNNEWSGCWIGENVNQVDGDELSKKIHAADIVFFNVHGGGFRVGSCTMFMDTYIEWIKVLKYSYGLEVMIMSVDHRLSPEYKYPSPVEDVVRAYEHLTRTLNVKPENIIAIGDSSGATLILDMLFVTHDPSMFEIVTDETGKTCSDSAPVLNELPRPAAVVFSSPIVTDETSSVSWKENEKHDYVSQNIARIIKNDYFEPSDSDSFPILGIAKLETGFSSFLPEKVLMYIGDKEVLRDDALDLAEKAKKDNVNWKTVKEDCAHNWFMVSEIVKDKEVCRRAISTFADFCYHTIRRSTKRSMFGQNQDYTSSHSNSVELNSFSSPKSSFEEIKVTAKD